MINLPFSQRINNRNLKFFILLFLICLIAPAAWAKGPFYIKNGGNDNAAGTSDATAWATLANVDNANFADGTDIYFKQNDTFTVSGDIDINHDGVNAGNRSIIGCYEDTGDFDCSGSRPIIQISSNGTVFRLNDDNEYLRFEYLDIRSTSRSWEDSGSEGIGTIYDGGGGNGEKGHIIINNCKFYHFGHYAIILARIGPYNIITNNYIEECGNGIYFVDEISGDGAEYNYVADNTCVDMVRYTNNQNDKVDGHCVSFQCGSYNIVEDNIGSSTKDEYNGNFNIWCARDETVIGNIYRRNESRTSSSPGINIMATANDNDDTHSNFLYQNILVNSASDMNREAIRLDKMTGSKGSRIFNNTIYRGQEGGLGLKGASGGTYIKYIHFKNNIVHLNGRSAGEDMLGGWQYPGRNNTFDYNLYWTALGSPENYDLWESSGGTDNDWSDWKGRGYDTNGVIGNPDFDDASNYDFTPETGSPAIDAGGYLSYVTTVTGTTVTVANNRWFHGDYGLVDEDGNAITGMQITFYDKTYGLQHRVITSDFINYGTPGTFVVNESIKSIYNSAHLDDPAYTTQVSLRFFGTRPDIGAKEYNSPLSKGGKTRLSPPANFKMSRYNNQ